MKPRATVVLTTYADDHRLLLCLSGYANQTIQDFEIVLVNDGGPRPYGKDPTERVVRDFRDRLSIQYLYLEPETIQFRLSAARNHGIRYARGDCIIFADGDSIPAPKTVENFLAYHRENRVGVGIRRRIARPLVHLIKEVDIPYIANLAYNEDERLTQWRDSFLTLHDATFEGCWFLCWGCLFSAPREKLLQIGGFDTEFVGWGAEDQDIAERLVRGAGCGLQVVPEAIVYHLDHPSRPKNSRLQEILQRIRENWTPIRNEGPLIPVGDSTKDKPQ